MAGCIISSHSVGYGTPRLSVASISRLSPSTRTNCSVTFDPPVRKGGRGPGIYFTPREHNDVTELGSGRENEAGF